MKRVKLYTLIIDYLTQKAKKLFKSYLSKRQINMIYRQN